jgi:hypothetical protein
VRYDIYIYDIRRQRVEKVTCSAAGIKSESKTQFHCTHCDTKVNEMRTNSQLHTCRQVHARTPVSATTHTCFLLNHTPTSH